MRAAPTAAPYRRGCAALPMPTLPWREPTMHVHSVICILIQGPHATVSLSAVMIRLQSFSHTTPTRWLTYANLFMMRPPTDHEVVAPKDCDAPRSQGHALLRGEGNDTGQVLPAVIEGAMAHDINEQHRPWDRRAAGGDA